MKKVVTCSDMTLQIVCAVPAQFIWNFQCCCSVN